MSLPIAWVLKEKHILLVGGGDVAETRVKKLVPNEALVTVVAPSATPYIEELAAEKKLTWIRRGFQLSDLSLHNWSFVLTAIDDHDTSREIAHQCRANRIPVNVADVIPLCDFYFGANFEQGPLKVMVSTGSGAPRLAKRILNELSSHAAKFQFGAAIEKVQRVRACLREQLPGSDAKISQTRMLLMKTLCDKLTFPELANLNEEEIGPLIRGMILSTSACPAHPIGETEDAADFVDEPKPRTKPTGANSTNNSESSSSNSSSSNSSTSDSSNSDSSSSDSSSSDSSSAESSDSDASEAHSSDSESLNKNTPTKPEAQFWRPKNGWMKRRATECAEGYPQPKVPPFPFTQHIDNTKRRRTTDEE